MGGLPIFGSNPKFASHVHARAPRLDRFWRKAAWMDPEKRKSFPLLSSLRVRFYKSLWTQARARDLGSGTVRGNHFRLCRSNYGSLNDV